MSHEHDDRREIDWRNIDWGRIEDFRPFLLGGIPVILLVIFAYTSIYTVQAESQGVVLRFGKFVKTVDPGLRCRATFQDPFHPRSHSHREANPGVGRSTQRDADQGQDLHRGRYVRAMANQGRQTILPAITRRA